MLTLCPGILVFARITKSLKQASHFCLFIPQPNYFGTVPNICMRSGREKLQVFSHRRLKWSQLKEELKGMWGEKTEKVTVSQTLREILQI